MKKLSDYKDEEAIELWANLIEPIGEIISDKEIANIANSNRSKIVLAKEILKRHKKEAKEILLTLDDTPLNALNIVLRLVSLINELNEYEEIADFFVLQGQTKTDNSSGSATENTEEEEI